MDKNAIKKYAVWARRELIERVSQRALRFGITADGNADPNADSVEGYLLSAVEKKQRAALIKKVEEHGYEQVLEEAAYTWFNRFAALRFMEVNGYLPSHVRVFTNEEGEFKPQILTEAIHLELDGLNMDKVYELKDANNTEELYRYLLIVQCNALSSILPGMFQRIEDYTELLLPENLLREGSVLQQMIELIPEEDWQEQVQIIGWLYQYYNTEPKDKVFADLKKNIKVTKEKIPAATQLFTPDWIVRYMVENSLGRLWIERKMANEVEPQPSPMGKAVVLAKSFKWKYYLPEAEQEEEVQKQLDEIRKGYASMKPEEIKVIDPCMGSGHILCYLFDVLVQIYEDYGHTAREAVEGILTNNLYGLDIDDRAAQLAYFAVMMKARQYDRRFFSRGIQPHVMAIQESNGLTKWSDMTAGMSGEQLNLDSMYVQMADYLIEKFQDAKEYGSILNVEGKDYHVLLEFVQNLHESSTLDLSMAAWLGEVTDRLPGLVEQACIMGQKYDVVVTNPPYMSSGGMDHKLTNFIKENYKDEKADIFATFIEHYLEKVRKYGFVAMITMESWMFLPVFESSRKKWLSKNTIQSLIHMPYLGKGGTSLGIAFGNASFVFCNLVQERYKGHYECIRYYETDDEGIPFSFPYVNERFGYRNQSDFMSIKSSPIAYWANESVFLNFRDNNTLEQYIDARSGISTGDNNRFYRCWFECDKYKIAFDPKNTPENSDYKWFPIIRGGGFRKWYGNMENVLNLQNEGFEIRNSGKNFRLRTPDFYNKKGITWNRISSRDVSFRVKTEQVNFGENSPCMFVDEDNYLAYIGFLNSIVAKSMLEFVNSTMTFQVIDIQSIPYKPIQSVELDELVQECIGLSKAEWDDYECSWDFQRHPLVCGKNSISDAFDSWDNKCRKRFNKLKENEERINSILISHYGLEDILKPEVDDIDITVRLADKSRDIKSFISYSVGCMFGRYSIDKFGLIYAGGVWEEEDYISFKPDYDAIIPISDDDYFEDDIVGRFVSFVEVVFGKNSLEDNLQFIADAIGGKGSARQVIRNYFLNEFYSDHCAMYNVTSVGKRPIYWLFDSGNNNGFKCLMYMHRYQPDTLARIRTDYIHEQQSRYRTVIESLEQRIAAAGSSSEKVKLTKLLNARQAQAKEIREYEEKVHHLADQMIKIDLDDGVKHNYAIFKDVLAKIK